MPIVDAHFHVWRQADLPWLNGPMQPRIFGPYTPIQRDYLMDEYHRDIDGTGVNQAVYVQANWPPAKAMDEVAWVSDLFDDTGWPQAIVGYADMTVDDARPALDRLAAFPLVRGIRQQFHWHENALYRFAAHADLCRDAAVQRNIAQLSDYGWPFDLQVFTDQMDGACALADACPEVTFVLQHAGMLEDVSTEGVAAWRSGMAALAERLNVMVKLSGFGTFLHRCDPDHIAWLTRETLALFGTDRCLWGSNFPIEKLWTDYPSLLNAHRAGLDDCDATDEASVFHNTACRVYRLN